MRKFGFIGLLNPKVSDSLQSHGWSQIVVQYVIRHYFSHWFQKTKNQKPRLKFDYFRF